MEKFIVNLVFILEKKDYDISYEELVPVICKKNSERDMDIFMDNIVTYILYGNKEIKPEKKLRKIYKELKYDVENILVYYWPDILIEYSSYECLKQAVDKANIEEIKETNRETLIY